MGSRTIAPEENCLPPDNYTPDNCLLDDYPPDNFSQTIAPWKITPPPPHKVSPENNYPN